MSKLSTSQIYKLTLEDIATELSKVGSEYMSQYKVYVNHLNNINNFTTNLKYFYKIKNYMKSELYNIIDNYNEVHNFYNKTAQEYNLPVLNTKPLQYI